MKLARIFFCSLVAASALSCMLKGQEVGAARPAVVPQLVNFSGKATDAQGKPIAGIAGITFSIYKDQDGGAPLWMETQNVAADSKGNYSAQLGAATSSGLPLDLFSTGEARWLGVRVSNNQEQPRVLLLSVPYALKAADAQTLGGLPASAFVLAAPPSGGNTLSGTASPAATTPGTVEPALAGTGTTDYVPLWTPNGSTLGNSVLFQTGSGSAAKVGINTTTPGATLDVKGSEFVRGTLALVGTGAGTAAAGKNSYPLNFTASVFNSGTGTAVGQTFRWQAEPAGNNTASPAATMNLLFASGAAAAVETGLKIANNGQITFAAGQTFPGGGSGTITGVTAGADLTGGGSTGNVTLNLDTTQVPLLAASNTFSGSNTFSAANTPIYAVSSGSNSGTIEGIQNATCCSSIGVYGRTSDSSGFGVEGYDSASSGNATGVLGLTFAPSGYGVLGSNAATTGEPTGVYGTTPNCSGCGFGVYGSGGIAGVVGTSNTGYAMIAQGNVEQCQSCGGWVKGMVYVNGQKAPYNIVRCFNSTLPGSAATTPPCGFTLTEVERSGEWIVDFGFGVTNRFWSATLGAPITGVNGTPSIAADNPWAGVSLTSTQLFVNIYSSVNWNFSLVVY